jgi:hydroxymethylbilane synthase
MAQAETVVALLGARGVAARLVVITTQGDQEDVRPVITMGQRGVFTSAIQQQLIDGKLDLAVHSLKDLPTQPDPRLRLAAVPVRLSARDVLVSRHADGLAGLPPGAQVGTGSLRRRAQLLALRPDLNVVAVRGNVETRIAMVQREELNAIVLAEAGLQRLVLTQLISHAFEPSEFLPAAGQGALGIEIRVDDHAARKLVEPLSHRPSMLAVLAERACLQNLHGGCLAPVGVWARQLDDHTFRLDAAVSSLDGRSCVRTDVVWNTSGDLCHDQDHAAQAGSRAARELQQKGADRLLRAVPPS